MGFAGLYCRGCTVALRTMELLIQCSGCGRHSDEGAAERNGWGYLSDGVELHPVCPVCLELERQGTGRPTGGAEPDRRDPSPRRHLDV